jgi:putative transcriptional regulator
MPQNKATNPQLEAMLLESVQQAIDIAEGRLVGRVTERVSAVSQARAKLKMPRAEFAQLLGVSPRTVENWEQGRRQPRGAARVLIAVAMKNPKVVLNAVNS